MPSSPSSCDGDPAGLRCVVVSTMAAGSVLPLELTVTSPASVLSSCVRLKNSVAVPLTVTKSPTTAEVAVFEVKTKMPSEVAGSVSAPASAVWRKNPFALRAVTMPVVVTSWPKYVVARPLPWIWLIAAGTYSQLRVAVELLRGVGWPTEKSAELLLESRQPPRLRKAAVVLLRPAAGAAPSKQLVLP